MDLRNKNIISLNVKTESESLDSLPMTEAGSEFQTDGAAHRKERFAKPVRANCWMSSGVADERSVRALTRGTSSVGIAGGLRGFDPPVPVIRLFWGVRYYPP